MLSIHISYFSLSACWDMKFARLAWEYWYFQKVLFMQCLFYYFSSLISHLVIDQELLIWVFYVFLFMLSLKAFKALGRTATLVAKTHTIVQSVKLQKLQGNILNINQYEIWSYLDWKYKFN